MEEGITMAVQMRVADSQFGPLISEITTAELESYNTYLFRNDSDPMLNSKVSIDAR